VRSAADLKTRLDRLKVKSSAFEGAPAKEKGIVWVRPDLSRRLSFALGQRAAACDTPPFKACARTSRHYYVLFVVAQKPIRQVYDPKASPQRPHRHGNASRDSAARGIRPCSCRAA